MSLRTDRVIYDYDQIFHNFEMFFCKSFADRLSAIGLHSISTALIDHLQFLSLIAKGSPVIELQPLQQVGILTTVCGYELSD